ncbi:MAG: ASPIC/UnbV domain-containing protein, partial [Acidobacteria bacterium]|nr:ASPIC/UnbV domain-containing protein [Acidobacteriota bacterium]
PARELQAGAGYWSSNGLVQVFGTPRNPTAVWVRWPGGDVTETTIETGMRDVTIGRDGALLRTP